MTKFYFCDDYDFNVCCLFIMEGLCNIFFCFWGLKLNFEKK